MILVNLNSTKANVIWATAIQILEKLTGYLVLVVLTRYLLKADLGLMFFAATVSGLGAILLNFGTDTHLIRAVASEPDQSMQHMSQVLSTRLTNVFVGYVLINLVFLLLRPTFSPVLLLVTAYDFLDEIYFCFSAFFIGEKRIIYRLLTGTTFKFLTLAVVSVVAILTRSLFAVLACYILVNLTNVLLAFAFVRRKYGPLQLHVDWRRSLNLMKISAPFFLLNFLTEVHMRFDTVMVGLFLDLKQVANYELGIKLMEVARVVVRPISMVFFPVFSEMVVRVRWHSLRLRFMQVLVGVVGIGFLLAIGMQLFGDRAIRLLFGSNYQDSVLPARVLFLSIPLLYINYTSNIVANAMRLEKKTAILLAVSVIMNIGLNILAIPTFGIIGAAWVTVITQLFLAITMLALVSYHLIRIPLPGSKTPLTGWDEVDSG